MEQALYNDWSFAALSPYPAWALALATVAIVAGLILPLALFRGEPRRGRRWAVFALRAVAAVALLFLLLEPGQRLMQKTRVRNRVALLVDTSASMGFPASPGGESRAVAAGELLRRSAPVLEELAQSFTLELWGFDRELRSLDRVKLLERPEELLAPKGGATDLVGALRQVLAGSGAAAGRRLSGALLISDGADNVELAKELASLASGEGGRALPSPLASLAADARAARLPISTLSLGAGGLRDLAIERVLADDFAFVRSPVKVTAVLRASGMGPLQTPVLLKRDGRVEVTGTASFPEGGGRAEVNFDFTPDRTGAFVYTVEVPLQAGEAIETNNALSFALKVIRDRVRVLLVVGRPSWDERFLRSLLKQDPNVDLVSFFILRSAADDPKTRADDELSLIPFPVREIFHEQIATFDLVILQNFSHEDRAYQVGDYLSSIRDYVQNGGALVMVGGDQSFGEGHYERTVLQSVLPVEPTGAPIQVEPFHARLTAEGRRHPVSLLAPSPEATEQIVRDLPELEGIQMLRAKAGSVVLFEHPFAASGGANAPLVVLGEAGRGRTMAIATDSLWKWAFGAAPQGAGARNYDRFWANAIRWLVRDPDLTPVKLAMEQSAVEPGEPLSVQLSARRADFGPAAGAEATVELVRVGDGSVVASKRATIDAEGGAVVELIPPEAGAFKVVAKVRAGEVLLGEAEAAAAARALGLELADATPRPELLAALAKATGGAHWNNPERIGVLPLVDPETVEVGRHKDIPLWDRWYWLGLFAAAIGAEWFLRRRWGYP